MNKTTKKGLIMTVITFLSAALATGFPVTNIQWIILTLVFLGTMLGYIGQSVLLPSTSVQGEINLRDIYKSLCISASTALSTFGAAAVTQTSIDWGEIAKNILILTAGYLVKQATTPAPKTDV